MTKEMKLESYKENIINGSCVGMFLLFSTFLVIRFSHNLQLLEKTTKFIVTGAIGYLLIGIVIMFIHRRERKSEPRNHYHNAGGLYGFLLISVFFEVSTTFLPRVIGVILWVNILVLFLLWLGEFYYLKNMAKKLNQVKGWSGETLLIELPEKTRGVEEAFAFLESYCQKNCMKLEILEKEIPGIVKIDELIYTISISMDYTIVGTLAYAIVLTTKEC